MKISSARLFALVFCFALAACVPLSQDITPPPGAVVSAPQSAVPPTAAIYFPLVPPNPAAGAAIFAEKCLACHGARGLGDGEQARQLPNPVTANGDPAVARQAPPAQWFAAVTQGNLERYMPPFESLSARQRWDVVAYVFTLSMPPEAVAHGETLFQANCASCHGATGKGDGPEAASLAQPPTNFTDQAGMAKVSAAGLVAGMAHPNTPALPDFSITLTENDRWDLADYLRSLTFAGPVQAAASPTENPTPEAAQGTAASSGDTAAAPSIEAVMPGVGTISGTVVNASGGEVPTKLEVTLYGYDHVQEAFTAVTSSKPDGTYAFENVELTEGRAFIVSVAYGGTLFLSDIVVADPAKTTLDLPVEIYETTTSTEALTIDRLHLFFEVVSPEVIRVAELFIISNPKNKVVVASEEGQPVLKIPIPEGATNLQFQDGALGGRYVETADGFGDTRGIFPGAGQYQLLFSVDLPYERKLDLRQALPLPVNEVVVVLPDVGLKLKGAQFTSQGTRDLQGTPYQIFSGMGFTAGSDLSLSLSGRLAPAGLTATPGSQMELAVGLGALAGALIVAGVWLYRRPRPNEAGEEAFAFEAEETAPARLEGDPDSLMDAIITLDECYQAGELPEAAYRERRAELKAQLQAVVVLPLGKT